MTTSDRRDDPDERFRRWTQMVADGACHPGDLAGVVQGCIAESGSARYFFESPQDVRDRLLEDMQLFCEWGEQTLSYPHAGFSIDNSREAAAALAVLAEAGVIDAQAPGRVSRKPILGGLEHLVDAEPLSVLLDVEPDRIDAMLIGVEDGGSRVEIGFVRHRRCFIDDSTTRFNEERVRQWRAVFALERCRGSQVTANFSSNRIRSIEFSPWQARPRARRMVDLVIKGSLVEAELHGDTIRLASLQEDPIEPDNPRDL